MSFFSNIFKGIGGVASLIPGGQLIGAGSTLIGNALGGGGRRPQAPSDLRSMYDQLANEEAGFSLANVGRRRDAQNRAYDALSDTGALNQASINRNRLLSAGGMEGMRQSSYLRDQGYSTGAQDAAVLGSRNLAMQQGNQGLIDSMSPEARANRAMAQAEIYNPGNSISSLLALQSSKNSQRIADAQFEAMRGPSVIESLLPVLGSIAGQYDVFGSSDGMKRKAPAKQGSNVPGMDGRALKGKGIKQ